MTPYIGLYVHIPFCAQKCHYCNFVITTKSAPLNAPKFLKSLEAEIGHFGKPLKRKAFDTLYVGGGTPSALDNQATQELFSLLRKNFVFKSGAEITWEANPGDIDGKKAELYQKLGINRISLGAQSFNDATLKKINRTHRSESVAESFRVLREAGFKNINCDLILALPGESLDEVRYSLEALRALSPEHVSLYELAIEDKTVFGRLHRQGKLTRPGEENELKMLKFARAFLIESGYRHYELLNYAKAGFESRHNQIYWANAEYLGLGPGAFSYIKGRRYQFAESAEAYIRKTTAKDWGAFEEEALSSQAKLTESLLLALRLVGQGVPLKQHQAVLDAKKAEVHELLGEGLLEIKKNHLFLSERGQLFAESVFSRLA